MMTIISDFQLRNKSPISNDNNQTKKKPKNKEHFLCKHHVFDSIFERYRSGTVHNKIKCMAIYSVWLQRRYKELYILSNLLQ